MPAEQLARPDHRRRSLPTAASASVSRAISPSATPTPSALAPRDRPMDFRVLRTATVAPRAPASAMRAAVSSGHLTWTKCTSPGSPSPASRIASRTPAATASTWARRPSCSGRSGAVCAWPSASAGGPDAVPAWRSNTSQCGAIAPSVPPDMTRQTCAARSRDTNRSSSWVSAALAKPRVKSLTSPLPSVLPKIATMPEGSIRPVPIAASIPAVSSGAAAGIRCTLATRRSEGSAALRGGTAALTRHAPAGRHPARRSPPWSDRRCAAPPSACAGADARNGPSRACPRPGRGPSSPASRGPACAPAIL